MVAQLTRPICEDCPMFNAYEGDSRSRGWCRTFDNPARGYHEMTQDCRNNLIEVVITLRSYAGSVEEQWSFFMDEKQITHNAIVELFGKYAPSFPDFYLYYWSVPSCNFASKPCSK